MNLLKRILRHINYKLEMFCKFIIVRMIYRKYWEAKYYNARLSTLIVNVIFQKIFRINGDVPWPVHYTSRVTYPKNIYLGKESSFSFLTRGGCYIQGKNGIHIGKHSIFAPGVKIISANHDPDNLDNHKNTRPVKIGNNCWIGANAVILPGVQLGDKVVVGAGSVVTKSFPKSVTIAGNPAKVINERE